MESLDEKEEMVVGDYVLGIAGNDYKYIRCIQEIHDNVEHEAPVPL